MVSKYIGTLLNRTIGRLYFRHVIVPRQTGNDGVLVLSFDPDDRSDLERMPYLLDALKERELIASFAAIGSWVEQYPALWKRVVREGHEIINHTYSHPDNIELNARHYHHLTREERKEEITRCHDVVKDVLGVDMKGFRTPHFGYQHTEDTYEILKEIGYEFSSSVVAMDAPQGRPFVTRGIKEYPLTYCPRHPWALFDSSHAFRGRFTKHTSEDFLRCWRELLESGCFLSIYLDPQDLKHFDVEAFLDAIIEHELRTVRYEDLP